MVPINAWCLSYLVRLLMQSPEISIKGGGVLEPETILRMSKQLLQAITFLHEIGYAHGGMVDPPALGP